MTLDYGMLLSPEPIMLSIGTLKAPTLREIARIGFDRLNLYEFLSKISPQSFYEKLAAPESKEWWDNLSDDERSEITIWDLATGDEYLAGMFVELFNFFLIEKVAFAEGLFVLLAPDVEQGTELKKEDLRGAISEKTFGQVLNLIQQICCIADKEENAEELKFKNNAARKLYEKLQKAKQDEKKRKKEDINLRLPNIISAVSNRHPTINPLNVWDLTVFQLLDTFNRMQNNSMFDINVTRVSVWGDEKNKFDPALWYKNHQETK